MSRLETLLEMASEEADAFTCYAIAQEYVKSQQFEEAFTWYERALAEDPEYIPAYHHFGLAKIETRDLDEADELLRKGLEIAEAKKDLHARDEIEQALEEL